MKETNSGSRTASSNQLNPRSYTGFACGKAILVGEHSVVYGAGSVAIPLKSMTVSLSLEPRNDSSEHNKLFLGGKEVSDRIADIIPDAFNLLGRKSFSLTIDGHSKIPIGAGLGSSATLCVATLRTILGSYGETFSQSGLAKLANKMEERFHGSPSGLDTAVVAHEEPILFHKGNDPKILYREDQATEASLHFALIDSKIRASTLAMIKVAKPYFMGSEGNRRLSQLDDLAMETAAAFRRHDEPAIAEAMSHNSVYLNEAGVVPEVLQQMIHKCRSLGVLGSKTTGAGGGGTLICLLDSSHWQHQLDLLKAAFPKNPVFHVSI